MLTLFPQSSFASACHTNIIRPLLNTSLVKLLIGKHFALNLTEPLKSIFFPQQIMWSALIIRSPSPKFLLLSLVLAQRQISSLINIIFSYKSFSHLCCNVKIPRLATPYCIFRGVTRISYILCSFPIVPPFSICHFEFFNLDFEFEMSDHFLHFRSTIFDVSFWISKFVFKILNQRPRKPTRIEFQVNRS